MALKTKWVKILILVFSIQLIFLQCKKFPEDEKRSSQTVTKRLLNKNWTIYKLEKNSIDCVDSVYTENRQPPASWSYRNTHLLFISERNEIEDGTWMMLDIVNIQGSNIYSSAWTFDQKREKIKIKVGGWNSTVFPDIFYASEIEVTYIIKKLTKTDLVLVSTGQVNNVRISCTN